MKISTLLHPHYIASSLKLIAVMPNVAWIRKRHRNVWSIAERNEIKASFSNYFAVEAECHGRTRPFYQLYDGHSCDRVYQAIQEHM